MADHTDNYSDSTGSQFDLMTQMMSPKKDILWSGYLLKKPPPKKPFGSRTWQRRYFELDSRTLRYGHTDQADLIKQVNLEGLVS
jgi:hypothetical protein